MEIQLYNTLNKKVELFEPQDDKNVRMYVCGPTVYDEPHVGNIRPIIVFDILYRILCHKYGKKSVSYARNITDVDDKIINSANEKNISIAQLTSDILDQFHKQVKIVNSLEPTYEPRATEHIDEMIGMVELLLKNNYAYVVKDHVFFEVRKFSNYGKLSKLKKESLIAGARVEINELKKDPLDFILWKPAKQDEPSWHSPWGEGRPGWHLECSVMSRKFLGKTFDIHGGGADLIFPHHENEIAQSLCAYNESMLAKYWVHNGFVTVEGNKMSKSLKNFITAGDLISEFPGEAIRLKMLMTHYRQPLDWTNLGLREAKGILDRWYEIKKEFPVSETKEISESFLKHLYQDMNTPKMLMFLHELAAKAMKGDKESAHHLLNCANFIGLLSYNSQEWTRWKPNKVTIDEREIENLIADREKFREQGDFSAADDLRKKLENSGVVLEDKDGKTTWKYK